ncbi:MAG: hypothetical protein JWO02_1281 [Solirubrobacterales bacterium]|nr:hypothetical protein [Solirubrobacterales bacterium]
MARLQGKMLSMPESSAITRLTLLPTAPRERGAHEVKVRRYRLAAVRPPQPRDAADRFARLKRTYD